MAGALAQIFVLRRKSAPDMPLRFVHVENLARLRGKGRIDLGEAFCHIFMYRTLADSEMPRRLTHRCIIVDDISRDLHRPLFNITFQNFPLQYLFLHCMQGNFRIYLFYQNQKGGI